MKYVSSSRRQVVMATLLALAVLGAVLRYWAPEPSTVRDIGTLLLVLWLPAVGNLVAFAIRKLPRRDKGLPGAFDDETPFVQHLVLRMASWGAITLLAGERQCTLVCGKEGFTARSAEPLALALSDARGEPDLALQLLRPGVALARLQAGTRVQVMVGGTVIAEGLVVR